MCIYVFSETMEHTKIICIKLKEYIMTLTICKITLHYEKIQ